MATKKAPKRGASRYQAPPQRKPLPGWVWLACGLVIGAFGFFLFSLEPGDDSVKRPVEKTARPEPARPKNDGQASPKPKYDFYTLLPESEVILPPGMEPPPPAPPPAKPVSAEEAARIDAARAEAALRGEVPPPAPPVAPSTPPAPATTTPAPAQTPPAPAPTTVAKAPTTQFFLQAGSFRRADEADKVRAQIILLGFDVRVETGDVRGETWHRVLVGPYADQGRMTQVQRQLAAAGFTNLLPQRRQNP